MGSLSIYLDLLGFLSSLFFSLGIEFLFLFGYLHPNNFFYKARGEAIVNGGFFKISNSNYLLMYI